MEIDLAACAGISSFAAGKSVLQEGGEQAAKAGLGVRIESEVGSSA